MYFLQKGFMEQYLYWDAHEEPYISHETMVEMIVGSTSSASDVHGVVGDNSNPYRTIVMEAIRMNQSHANQCLIVDKEPLMQIWLDFLIF
jgi:hypothetical protein